MISGAMTLLKMKERYTQCTFSNALASKAYEAKTYIWIPDNQVSATDEEAGRLVDSHYIDHPNDEGGIALLDTELPAKRARKKPACCMCCGLE